MKQRKASTKCLSILLIVSMLLSGICIPIAAADTESGISTNDLSLDADTTVSSLTSADLPETMTLASAMSAGHVKRLRDEEPDLYTVVFENADGTNTAYIFSEPVKYDDNGVIRDKSTSIFAIASSDALPSAIGNASSYAYKTTNNDVKVYFGASSSQGVSLTYQEYTIRSYPETSGGGASTYALQAQASGVLSTTAIGYASENAKNALQYASGVGRGSVLEYIPTLNGLKENIVLSSFTGQTAFAFRYETNGLALRECDGEVQFIAPETEEVVGRFAPIISYGADGERSLGSLTVTPIVENQSYRVTVNVDEQFLRDAAYPVTVDPTVTMGSANLHDLTLYHSTGVDPDTEEPMIHAGGATSLLGTQMDDPGKYRIVYWFPISSLNTLLAGTPSNGRSIQLVPWLNLGNDASGNIEAYPYLKAGTNSAFDDLGETAVYAPPPPEESDGEIYWWSHDENGDFCDITPVSSFSGDNTAINITTSVEYYLSYVDSFVDEESNIEKCAVMLISSNEDGVYDDDYIEFYTQESGNKAYLVVNYASTVVSTAYYFNNYSTGKFIARVSNSGVRGKSGLLNQTSQTYYDMFRQDITFIQISENNSPSSLIRCGYRNNDEYVYGYLYDNNGTVEITTNSELATAYWNITPTANGQYLIQNRSTLRYMYMEGEAGEFAIKTKSSSSDQSARWARISCSSYKEVETFAIEGSTWLDFGEQETYSVSVSGANRSLAASQYFTWSGTSTGENFTVYPSGTVTAPHQNSIATLTATHIPTGRTATFRVATGTLEEGIYFIQNKASEHFLSVLDWDENVDSADDVFAQEFRDNETRQWNIQLSENGYYTIQSVDSLDLDYEDSFLGIKESSDERAARVSLETEDSLQYWNISTTSSGAYRITPKDSPTNAIQEYFENLENSVSVLFQAEYSPNTDYSDEWNIYPEDVVFDACLIAIERDDQDRTSMFDDIKSSLNQMGYNTIVTNAQWSKTGVTAESLLSYMRRSKICLIRSHGDEDSMQTLDGVLSDDDISWNELQETKLILFVGCTTGRGGESSESITTQAVAIGGASTAIGFRGAISRKVANTWSEFFFENLANYSGSEENAITTVCNQTWNCVYNYYENYYKVKYDTQKLSDAQQAELLDLLSYFDDPTIAGEDVFP